MSRMCACGCGTNLDRLRADARWATDSCRKRLQRAASPDKARTRPPTRKALALALLRASGDSGVCTAEFMRAGVGSRYGARLKELRDEGHHIITTYERQGSHRYFLLTAEPSTSQPNKSLSSSEAAGAGRQHGVGGSLFEVEPINAAVADWEAA